MTHRLLPLSMHTHSAARRVRQRLRQAWQDRADETGVDEAVTKMIWLAVGIGVALTATVFFTGVFEMAQDSVPDPVTP